MKSVEGRIKSVMCLKVESGEDVLISLQNEVTRRGVRSGIILNGIGSVSAFHTHVVKTTNLPPGPIFLKKEGPYDISAMNGFVIDGRVHSHIIISSLEETYSGHLEEGTIALTFCAITVVDISDASISDFDDFPGRIRR